MTATALMPPLPCSAIPDACNAAVPSVIGRGIIGNWTITIPRDYDTFIIVPYEWSEYAEANTPTSTQSI